MARSNVANAVSTTLASAMTSGSTTIEVASATDFPAVPFYVVIDPYNDSAREFILVGGKSGTTFDTLSRNLAGSQSQDHGIGDILRSSYTAQTLEDLWDFIDALPTTHATLPDLGVDDHHPQVHTIVSHDTDATGAQLTELTNASETALHSHPGGGGAVDSVFGRTGAVTAALNDYLASLVDNDSTVSGATVKDALNTLLGTAVSGMPYFVPNTGFDMRSDIQTAINDAESDNAGEVVLDRGNNVIGSSTLTDFYGDKVGLLVPRGIHVRGQGMGTDYAISGATQRAPTVLYNDVAPSLSGGQEYHLMSISRNSPSWIGSRVSHFHFQDAQAHCHSLLNCHGMNNIMVEMCSFGEAGRTGSKQLEVRQPPDATNNTTQYGQIMFCNFHADHHGIWFDGNNPDWEIWGTQIQSSNGPNPVSGSTGIYIGSSAIRVLGGEIQMFDIGVEIDGSSGEGKHVTLRDIHFEAHQSAASDAYEAAVKVSGSGNMYALMSGCEIGNSSRFVDAINIASGVVGTNIQHFRVRGSRWMASTSDALITDNGTGTVVSV